jgi:hypothetical protein
MHIGRQAWLLYSKEQPSRHSYRIINNSSANKFGKNKNNRDMPLFLIITRGTTGTFSLLDVRSFSMTSCRRPSDPIPLLQILHLMICLSWDLHRYHSHQQRCGTMLINITKFLSIILLEFFLTRVGGFSNHYEGNQRIMHKLTTSVIIMVLRKPSPRHFPCRKLGKGAALFEIELEKK